MDIKQAIASLPKVELHLHLEGSIQPETLVQLARRHKVELPAPDAATLRKWFAWRDFPHFIQGYLLITRCLRDREDYELAVTDLARELARQNCRYAEVTFSPGTHAWMGVKSDIFLEGLARGRKIAHDEFGVELNWVFDIVRNAEDTARWADTTLRIALEYRGEGVIALGLGGMEQDHPPQPFAKWFEKAKSEGLMSVPHAGEHVGPASIRGALTHLHADRIGHGVRAIEDPALVEELAARGITLEICPASNICLGVYPDYAAHPLRRLAEAGVPVTVNTDDPPLFNITLEEEVERLHTRFGYALAEVSAFQRTAIDRSYASETLKSKLHSDQKDWEGSGALES